MIWPKIKPQLGKRESSWCFEKIQVEWLAKRDACQRIWKTQDCISWLLRTKKRGRKRCKELKIVTCSLRPCSRDRAHSEELHACSAMDGRKKNSIKAEQIFNELSDSNQCVLKQVSSCSQIIPYGSLQAEEEQTPFRFANWICGTCRRGSVPHLLPVENVVPKQNEDTLTKHSKWPEITDSTWT